MEWAVDYPSEQRPTERFANDFAATPDLSLAAYVCSQPDQPGDWIRVIDLRNGRELWKAKATTSLDHYLTALSFSPGGKTLASAATLDNSTAVIQLVNMMY